MLSLKSLCYNFLLVVHPVCALVGQYEINSVILDLAQFFKFQKPLDLVKKPDLISCLYYMLLKIGDSIDVEFLNKSRLGII